MARPWWPVASAIGFIQRGGRPLQRITRSPASSAAVSAATVRGEMVLSLRRMVPSMSLAISRTVTRPPYGGHVGKPLIELRDIPVTRLAGVGPARADGLGELGIENVLDLLLHYPRRYIDRTKQATIRELAVGEEATILAVVRRSESRRTRQRRTMVTV